MTTGLGSGRMKKNNCMGIICFEVQSLTCHLVAFFQPKVSAVTLKDANFVRQLAFFPV